MTAKKAKEIRVGVNGAGGRMGTLLVRLVVQEPGLKLGAALDAAGHPSLGKDAGAVAGLGESLGVVVWDTLTPEVDVMIDFSLPDGTMRCVDVCASRKIPMVVGTTGLDPAQIAKLQEAAKVIPIVFAPNMSVGVNVLLKVVGEVAQKLGGEYDVEIVEMHHRFKKDAPSGTALKLAEQIAKATGRDVQKDAVFGRAGNVGERRPNEIGILSVRGGDVVGEHTVTFAGLGERIELSHKAGSRETFARGALRAARFVLGKKPGLYSMLDVLGM